MRTVASENESQGARGPGRPGTRSASIRKSRLRAAVLEALEPRTLLAVLPAATVQGQVDISDSAGLFRNSLPGSHAAPSVAIDPTAPQDMVAVWVTDSIGTPIPNNGQTAVFIEMAFSTNAGGSWSAPTTASLSLSDIDFNQSQANGPRFFAQVTDPTVAFDAQHNFYVLDSPHAGDFSSGEIKLNKFSFAPGGSPSAGQSSLLYRWAQQDAVYRPTLAVDSNPNFSGINGQGNPYNQVDPNVNNVYVAWATNLALTPNTGQVNPNRIALLASADGGTTFSAPEFVDGANFTGTARDASPQIVISQGRPIDTAAYGGADPGVRPGQVTVIWDDTGTLSNQGFDRISSSRILNSGAGQLFTYVGPTALNEASAPPFQGNANLSGPATTEFDVPVNLPAGFTPTDLSVTLGITHANLSELTAVLMAPDGKTYTLFRNKLTNDSTVAANPNIGLTGANLGQAVSGAFVGTTFNDNAPRPITNNAGGAASVGTFRGEGNLGGPNPDTSTSIVNLLTGGPASGTWKVFITDERNDSAPVQFLSLLNLRFTGLTVDANTVNTPVATTSVRGAVNAGAYPLDSGGAANSPVPATGIGPGAVIASDNTLGAFSPHEGRLYVAYTDRVTQTHLNTSGFANVNNPADNTDIYLQYSDDGGASWHSLGQVNDDNATTDGYTGAGATGGGTTLTLSGRPQFQPAAAVDPATGTLVITFRDARDDASRNRVADYIATSIDGGQSFGPQTFVNPAQTATDAITNQVVVLGPVPDNSTIKNAQRDTLFDFGDRQALAVLDGRVYPVWASNQNGFTEGNSKQNIFTADVSIAAGPRIIDSTMGPAKAGTALVFDTSTQTTSNVNFNNQFTADGTPILNGFRITFDRPIDPATFTAGDVTITYHNTAGGTQSITPGSVKPIFVAGDPNQNGHFGFEQFLVSFAGQSGVGTYTYTVGPNISDRIVAANVLQPAALPPVTVTNPLPTAIPTSGTGGSGTNADVSTSVIQFSGHGTQAIGNITVRIDNLNMATGSLGALKIELLTASGDDIVLYNNPGDPHTLFNNTTFDDNGIPINQIGVSYASQTIQPQGFLNALDGELVDQNYVLRITDQQSGNTGTLFTWSITITPVSQGAGLQNGTLMDQDANGTGGQAGLDVYSVPTTQDTLPLMIAGPRLIGSGVPGTPSSGPTLALNQTVNALDVTFDHDMQVGSFLPASVLQMMGPAGPIAGPFTVTPAFNSPVRPDNPTTIAPGQTINSAFTITNTGTFTIADLRLRFDLSALNDGSVTAVLRSPGGKAVTLFGGATGPVGVGRADFTDTVLDDHATTPLALGQAPFTGSFRPAQSLDAAYAGLPLAGQWQLSITNGSATNPATLNSWSLEATPQKPTATTNSSGPVTIPAGQTQYATLSFAGPSFTLGDLMLALNLSTTDDGKLSAVLFGPGGQAVILFGSATGPVGVGGAGFVGTVLSDNAATPLAQGTPPFTGTFRAAQSLDAVFAGRQLTGTWKLGITNNSATTATLNSWSLTATAQSAVPQVVARTFRIGFPTQQLSGTYTVQIASSVRDAAGDALDQNVNAGLEVLRQVANNGATTPIVYSNNTPQTISDVVPNNVTTSVINIPDDFPIQSITLRLNITYPNDPDLTVLLVAPEGPTIQLFQNVGATGTRANFTDTVFDDAATTSIKNGGPPFPSQPNSNHYRPEQSLDQVLNTSSKGVWKLVILDTGTTNLAGKTSQLNNWSLTLGKGQPTSGLGEAVADQATGSFRIFTMDPTNPLSSDVWTAVGPASIGGGGGGGPEGGGVGGRSGRIGGIAVDPSDPSGNTVYIGGASGGVWKTTNFLSPNGPTYIPLTDFGASFAINIGGLAVFGRNNDPRQSIIFAATGEGDTGSPGVGFLRSMDGGATWTLLDSTDNTLPFTAPAGQPQRDHIFPKGSTAFKVVVDPTPTPTGDVIVYAALSGANGGIWRSVDTGMHWQLMRAGQATDLVLDPGSGQGAPGGNLQIVYAGFRGEGVFISPNRGQNWSLMAGNQGNPLIFNEQGKNVNPTDKGSELTPNGANGRIVLAKPALTGNAFQDSLYEGWLYATVITPDSHFAGLFLTKDFGQNWTRVRIPTMPPFAGTIGSTVQAVPTNDISQADYDIGGGPPGTGLPAQGNYDVSMAIDPTNPNVVYIGGTADGQPSGFIRVDTTGLFDAHALVPLSGSQNDGGNLQNATTGRAVAIDPTKAIGPGSFLNFISTSTTFVRNASAFSDTGAGATWIPFDIGGTDQHRIVTFVDPLTGHGRIIIGDDQGVFTTVDNNGTFDAGIGTASNGVANSTIGDRNGNLQITQFYYGTLQPSNVAALAAQALFYASAQDNGGPQSNPNVIGDPTQPGYGDISWGGPGGDATGVATDQTGSGTFYQYWWPCCGGNYTDFFQVNGAGATSGLLQTSNGLPTPDPQWPSTGGSNFAVNPINGDQIIISSQAGRIFRTEDRGNPLNQGGGWFVIGNPAALDGTYAPAVAFGAPDPNGPSGVGNLDDYLFVGTSGGHIFVTQTGGGGNGNQWTDISAGLDGSSVQRIITNPTRGSHEAYAVTSGGVFHIVNAVSDPNGPAATQWVNISSNISQLSHAIFGDPSLTDTLNRGLTSIWADWRYVIPDLIDPGTHPALYVGGTGGVYRSLDNGQTWAVFPNVAINGSPVDGGYLPVVGVTDLQGATGRIDPTTGRAIAAPGDPNLLMATTFGRGAFGIRLAPIVFPNTNAVGQPNNFLFLDPTPASDTGTSQTDQITNTLTPFIDGVSEQTAFGNTVSIKLYDHALDPNHLTPIGTGTTDANGHFKIQINLALVGDTADGLKTIDIQATDQSGTPGNIASFTFTLDRTPPVAPSGITLDPSTDTGRLNGDSYTADNNSATHPAPLFDVTGVEPNAVVQLFRNGVLVNTVRASAAGGLVQVPDLNLQGGTVIAGMIIGGTPAPIPDSPVGSPRDTAPPAGNPYVYTARQIDVAGNTGPQTPNGKKVIIDTVNPVAPTGITLDPSTDSGRINGDQYTADNNSAANPAPVFDVTGVEPNAIVQLFRNGVLVNTVVAGTGGGTVQIADLNLQGGTLVNGLIVGGTPAPIPDSPVGVPPDTAPPAGNPYVYTALQVDLAGNVGPQTTSGAKVIIDTGKPAAPSGLTLDPTTDSGRLNGDDYTANNNTAAHPAPLIDITGIEPNAIVQLFRDGVLVNTIVAPAVIPANGIVQIADLNLKGGTVVNGLIVGGTPTPIPDSPVGSPADTPPPAGNPYQYTAKQIDLAGNLSSNQIFGAAGTVVIGGDDGDLHGSFTGGVNVNGWLYMQKVLENITPKVANGNKLLVALGADPNGISGRSIESAFTQATLPAGWTIVHVIGSTNIDNFLKGLPVGGLDAGGVAVPGVLLSNTGLLYITTLRETFDDLDDNDQVVLNAHGAEIKAYVNTGGGLFTQTESNVGAGEASYGWLPSIFPGIGIDNSPGGGGVSPVTATLTPQGQAAFPGLVASDLQAGPVHNFFTGNLGGLTVLATVTISSSDPTQHNLILTSSVGARPLNVIIDATPPAAPTLTLDPSTDSGRLNGDEYTVNNNTAAHPAPLFNVGNVEPNAVVQLFRNGVLVNTITANATGGTFQIADLNLQGGTLVNGILVGGTPAPIPDSPVGNPRDTAPPAGNPYKYTVKQIDLAGNLGAPSAQLPVIVDTAAPAAPTVSLDPSSDTGRLNNDAYTANNNTTPANAPLFDVRNLEPNSIIQLYRDGVLVNTVVVPAVIPASGFVTIADLNIQGGTLQPDGELTGGTPAVIADSLVGTPPDTAPPAGNPYQYTVLQIDLAGNTGPLSATPASVIVDTKAPQTPDLKLDPASDSGTANNDNYTANNNTAAHPAPLFDITKVEPNATVQLFRNGVLVNTIVAPAVLPANGLVQIADLNLQGGTLVNGLIVGGTPSPVPDSPLGSPADTAPPAGNPYTYTAKQVDLAGNLSQPSTTTFGNTGAIVIDGTDSPLHGDSRGPGNTNEQGWLYMQKVLNLIEPNISNGQKILVALGVDSTNGGGLVTQATNSVFAQSNLARDGWTIVFVTGNANINTFLSGGAATTLTGTGAALGTVTLAQTGLLMLPTENKLGDDLTDQELATINTHSLDIKDYVNAGGGLYAETELPSTPGVIAFGWLQNIFPGLTSVESGGTGQNAVVTPVGQTIFPTASANDFQSAIWHNYFTGNFGTLGVVVTVPNPSGNAGDPPVPLVLASTATGGTTTAPYLVTIDATPPAAPSAPVLEPASDTGTFNNDRITNANNSIPNPSNAPVFDVANIEPNAIVRLFRAPVVGGVTGTPVLVKSVTAGLAGGTVAIADTNAGNGTIPDGTYVYTALQVDLAGNVGVVGAGTTVRIDHTPPSPPPAPDLEAASDTGTFNNDDVTGANNSIVSPSNAPVFDVTGIEANASVKLFRNGTLVNTLTNTAGGNLSIADINGGNGTIPDGKYTYRFQQVDLAGNVSTLSPGLSVTIDHTVPLAPTSLVLEAASDTGTFNNDDVTAANNSVASPSNAPVFDATGIEPNATVKLFRAPVVGGVTGAAVLVNTLTNTAGGTVAIADTNAGNGKIADGTYIYTVQQVDLAGNTGPMISPGLRVVIDSTLPAGTAVRLDAASDTGGSNTDGVTQITLFHFPVFNVSPVEPGATVNLYRNGVIVATVTNTVGGTVQITDAHSIPDGVYTYSAQQVDLSGNAGPIGTGVQTQVVTYDTKAPTILPAPVLDPASDSGVPGDNLTSATSPTLDITNVEVGAKLVLLRGGVAVQTIASAAPVNGVVRITDPGPVPDGVVVYTAFQADLAGNTSPISPGVTVTIRPDAPGTITLDTTTDSGTKGDNITNATKPTLDVAGVTAGVTLQLLRNGVVVATRANAPAGTVSITDPGPLTAGQYTYTAVQVDASNGSSPPGPALVVTVVTSAPTPGLALDTASDSGTKGDFLTNVKSPTFDISSVSIGATVKLLRGGVVVATLPNAGGGTVAVTDPGPLADGQYFYTVQQTDVAGNVSGTSGVLTLTVNTATPPPVTLALDPATNSGAPGGTATSNPKPAIDIGGIVSGATVKLFRNGALIKTLPNASATTATFTEPSALAAGQYTYTAQQLSAAGTASTTTTFVLTIDASTPPAVAVALDPTSDTGTKGDHVTGTNTNLVFDITNVVPGATVSLLRNNIVVATIPNAPGTTVMITDPGKLGAGQYSYTAQQTSGAGIQGPVGAAFGLTITSSPNGAVAGDYNGDGKADLALFRRDNPASPGQALWFVPNVTPPAGLAFGSSTLDVPIAGDFNGDGKTDIGLYRPSTATWIIPGITPASGISFGGPSDIPVPADYDGVGHAQIATYRPSTGQWFIAGHASAISFGGPNDIPVPADYFGTGHVQLATYRPSTGTWFVGGIAPVSFGGPNDYPVPADYDGVGHAQIATFRPGTAQWFVAGHAPVSFGGPNDVPVPADYLGVGHVQMTTYRQSTGTWYIGGIAPISFGGPNDIPAEAPYVFRRLGGLAATSIQAASVTALDLAASAVALSTGQGTGTLGVSAAAVTAAGQGTASSSLVTTTVHPPIVTQRIRPNVAAHRHPHPFPSLAQFIASRRLRHGNGARFHSTIG